MQYINRIKNVRSSDRMVERAQAQDGLRASENETGDKCQNAYMPIKALSAHT